MLRLASLSLRRRPNAYVAPFVSVFLGATILMSFASMLDTLAGPNITPSDSSTLLNMALVVGGWSFLIVGFAVASTLGLSVRQRSTELALLKSVGATPRQIRRLVVGEAGLIAVVAATAAIPMAIVLGRVVFELLQGGGQLSEGIDHRFGALAVTIGMAVCVLASTVAARFAVHRTARRSSREASADPSLGAVRLSRKRRVAAGLLIAVGLQTAVVTAFAFTAEEGPDAMATGGQSAIWLSAGLALLAPALLRGGARVLAGPVQSLGGESGRLALENIRARSEQLASGLWPIILFIGIGTGATYMQLVENRVLREAGLTMTHDQRTIATLNWVLVGMLGVFAAIMVVNTLIAVTSDRRTEFAQLRLAGATPSQVEDMVRWETSVLAATGLAAGSVAAGLAAMAYTIHRTSDIVPGHNPLPYLAFLAGGAGAALAASRRSTTQALREPAIALVAA